MPDLKHQPSMAAGEIGPHLYGRIDQEMYYIGLRTCRNAIVRKYGGVMNRPGKKFTCEAKHPDRKVRLIDFTFNEQQTYALEFGHQYMRVIKDGGQVIETGKTITGITNANPGVLTIASHGYADGEDVYLSGIGGTIELNGRTLRIDNATTNTFTLTDFTGIDIDTTDYGTFTSGGTASKVFEVSTPYDETDLFELNFAQDNDVLTMVHNDYYPRDITRTDHDAWTVAEFSNTHGPFKDINGTDTTMYASAATGTGITLTASAAIFSADMVDDLVYLEQKPDDDTDRWEVGKTVVSGDVRRAGFHYYEAQNGGDTGSYRPDHIEGSATDGDGAVEWLYLHSGFGIAKITGFTSSTVVTADVITQIPANAVGSGNASINWALAAWSDTEGYPAACAYHKQRFDFGGTRNQPNGLWMSGTALRTYFGRSSPILDDDAIKMRLNTTGSNSIRHLLPLADLIALTSASEHLISGRDGLILASEVPINKVQGYTGASSVRPLIINNTALFVQDYGSIIRSLQYQLDSDSFGGIDLTARSPHLFENKQVVDWAYARHPMSVIWVVMDDGSLNGLTFMEEQKVYAWHRHDTDGTYESVCTIREGEETASYFVVNRTINGSARRYIERMASRNFTDLRDAYFLDSGLSYDGRNTGSDTMTISGGTAWDQTEALTITASAAHFLSTDVENEVAFFVDGSRYSLVITAYTSSTVVTAVPNREIPSDYRGMAFTNWELARKKFSPLHHLSNRVVNALADGYVDASLPVINGSVTLTNPAAVVHIGLPYTSEVETLDINVRSQQQGSSRGNTVIVPRIFMQFQDTRPFKVYSDGLSDEGVNIRDRDVDEAYSLPSLLNGLHEQILNSSWSKHGRVGIMQDLPLPFTVNLIAPEVEYGQT